MAENDEIRLEIAFEGGQIIGGTVSAAVSKAFHEAVQNTERGSERETMGPYYPRTTYYDTAADFEREVGCR